MPLKISRILHAGYVFEYEGARIAFDPVFENPFSRNCHAFPAVKFDTEGIRNARFDAVFISHYHDDHCSFDSLNLLDRNTPLYIFCVFDEMLAMLRELGFQNVFSLTLNTPVVVGGIEVIPRRALDADVDSLFHIRAGALNILNVVDSWIDDETLQLLAGVAPWDLVLWPFQTMREIEVLAPSRAVPATGEIPPEWIEQLSVLKPRYVVPSSCQFRMEEWSWYNRAFFPVTYAGFEKQIVTALPSSQVVRMNPGVSVLLEGETLSLGEPLSWIEPVGEQNVDYVYSPSVGVPPTAEIAQRFVALSADESDLVYSYCAEGLPERYRSLGEPDEYFLSLRFWQLSIYDHAGIVQKFFYRIEGEEISLVESCSHADWATEVPAAKLYAALARGESLTSMYMRIVPAAGIDVVEDPLVRCLFNGVFGAYQRAQLTRLREQVTC